MKFTSQGSRGGSQVEIEGIKGAIVEKVSKKETAELKESDRKARTEFYSKKIIGGEDYSVFKSSARAPRAKLRSKSAESCSCFSVIFFLNLIFVGISATCKGEIVSSTVPVI